VRPAAGGPGRTRVLYIGGWGRSGSTLLDRVLGQVPGVVSLGEVRELWQRGWVENRPCGCGAPFADCPFWTEVGRQAFGGWARLDRDEVLRLRYSLDRPWATPVLLGRRSVGFMGRRVATYTSILDALYRAIHDVSGGKVIVDSSKLPSHALLLRRIPALDLRMVHLVRDSRGVVFSWKKRVVNRVTSGPPQYMEKYDTFSASARYLLYNGLTAAAGRKRIPYLRVRYEDFVGEPRRTLESILEHAGIEPAPEDLSFLRDGEVALAPNHTVDGNPVRFSVGPVRLRVDDAWRSEMSPRDRFWVTTLTSPMLRSYGYPRRAET
jgi:hypothetical protein